MRPTRRFLWALGAILVVAFSLRTAYTLAVTRHDTDLYDQTYYELQAHDIAQAHKLFDDPFVHYSDPSKDTPAADHPPLTVVAFLPAALIGDADTAALAMRFTTVAFGVASVMVIALIAREVAGEAVGLLAGVIAAVDPNLWMNDGLIMSESLAVLLTAALTLVVVRRGWRPRTRPEIVLLGLLIGLLALARTELVLLVPLLIAPVLWRDAAGDRRRALRSLGVVVAVAAVVIAPWVAWNLVRFERPVYISTSDGLAIAAASCDAVYYGPRTGWADVFACSSSGAGIEQSVWNDQNRAGAIDYIRGHLQRAPVVALARIGRVWDVWSVADTNAEASIEGRPVWASRLGDAATWVLVPLAVLGAVVQRRRGISLLPLVAPAIAATLALALVAGGLPRYRAPAEPGLIVLAAVGAMALRTRRARQVAAA